MKQQVVIPRNTNHFKKCLILMAFVITLAPSVQATPPNSPPLKEFQQAEVAKERAGSAQIAITKSNRTVRGRIVPSASDFRFQTLSSNQKSQSNVPSTPSVEFLLSELIQIEFPGDFEVSADASSHPNEKTSSAPQSLSRLRLVGRQMIFAQIPRLDQKAISVRVFDQPPVLVPISEIVTLEFPLSPDAKQEEKTNDSDSDRLSIFPKRGPRSQDVLAYRKGGELYGRFVSGSKQQIEFSSLLGEKSVARDQVAALYFAAREIPPGGAEGLFVGVTLKAPARKGPLGPISTRPVQEYLKGQLIQVSETSLTIDSEILGQLAIPLDRVAQMKILHRGPRITLDPHTRRLGNAEQGVLGASGAEGTRLTIPFSLKEVPLSDLQGAQAYLVVSVFEMESQQPGQRYTEQLTDGHLRTSFSINGQSVDYLNRHIRPPSSARQRLRVPIPIKLLKAERNQLEFVQTPSETNAKEFDDCELWSVGLEFEEER